jgi:hypothetical protein
MPPPDEPTWTVEALRAHLESLIAAVDAKHQARTATDDDHRRQILAELHAADGRASQQYAAMRADLDGAADRLAAQIQALTDRINRAEGNIAGAKESRAGLYGLIATIGVVITIVVVIASIINGQGGG